MNVFKKSRGKQRKIVEGWKPPTSETHTDGWRSPTEGVVAQRCSPLTTGGGVLP